MATPLKLFLIVFVSVSTYIWPQNTISTQWTTSEINQAHTAKNVHYLSDIEKETILYINLARMHPQKFMKVELDNYLGPAKYGDYLKGSPYIASLLKELKSLKALPALSPDSIMSDNADCFAVESGQAGTTGHQRKKCPKMNFAECCSYGMNTGRDIALQLLIDHKTPSLGHRRICLDKTYTKIGVAHAQHKIWEDCCVLEII